jgi:hypothetical protein
VVCRRGIRARDHRGERAAGPELDRIKTLDQFYCYVGAGGLDPEIQVWAWDGVALRQAACSCPVSGVRMSGR